MKLAGLTRFVRALKALGEPIVDDQRTQQSNDLNNLRVDLRRSNALSENFVIVTETKAQDMAFLSDEEKRMARARGVYAIRRHSTPTRKPPQRASPPLRGRLTSVPGTDLPLVVSVDFTSPRTSKVLMSAAMVDPDLTPTASPLASTECGGDQVEPDMSIQSHTSAGDTNISSSLHSPRPATDEEIDSLFQEFAARNVHFFELRSGLSIDQKWYLVYNDQFILRQTNLIREQLKREGTGEYEDHIEGSPGWYIMRMLDKTITLKDAERLRVSLRYGDAKWFRQFISMQGACVLALNLAHISRYGSLRSAREVSIEYEIVICLRNIFNSSSATPEALMHDRILAHIVSSLNTPHIPTRKSIMDILIILVHWNQGEACDLIMPALEALSMSNNRNDDGVGCYEYWFQSLESSLILRETEPVEQTEKIKEGDRDLLEYALASLRMINGILTQLHDPDLRRHHRNQMELAGLKRIIRALRRLKVAAIDEQFVILKKLSSQEYNVPAAPLNLDRPLPDLPDQEEESATTSHVQRVSTLKALPVRPVPSSVDDEDLHQYLRELIQRRHSKNRRLRANSWQAGASKKREISENVSLSDNELYSGSAHPARIRDVVTSSECSTSRKDPKIEDLVVALEGVFSNRKRYKQLLSCEPNAQKLLDMFQRVLDSLDTSRSKFRSDLIVATQRLAGKSGLYPMCFDLKDVTTVGEFCESNGAFADIYKGTFQNRLVCLKTIRLDQKTDIQHFLKVCSKEAILWGQLSHPNLLPFYGIYRFRNRLSLVSPWMKHGDIASYLRKHPSANRLLLASDVARGLRFLHDNDIIHGDLKGPNILVNELERACVADFGLSSISDPEILAWTSQSSVASRGGSVRWQAPELFDPEKDEDVHNTVFSDVYAWACVAYEIFAGQVPFSHISRDTTVSFKVRDGERPTRPEDLSLSWTAWGLTEDIWALMEDGWTTDPQSRPSVGQIIQRLGAEMRKNPASAEDAERHNGWNSNALSPGQFRKLALAGMDVEDISVQSLGLLLNVK